MFSCRFAGVQHLYVGRTGGSRRKFSPAAWTLRYVASFSGIVPLCSVCWKSCAPVFSRFRVVFLPSVHFVCPIEP